MAGSISDPRQDTSATAPGRSEKTRRQSTVTPPRDSGDDKPPRRPSKPAKPDSASASDSTDEALSVRILDIAMTGRDQKWGTYNTIRDEFANPALGGTYVRVMTSLIDHPNSLLPNIREKISRINMESEVRFYALWAISILAGNPAIPRTYPEAVNQSFDQLVRLALRHANDPTLGGTVQWVLLQSVQCRWPVLEPKIQLDVVRSLVTHAARNNDAQVQQETIATLRSLLPDPSLDSALRSLLETPDKNVQDLVRRVRYKRVGPGNTAPSDLPGTKRSSGRNFGPKSFLDNVLMGRTRMSQARHNISGGGSGSDTDSAALPTPDISPKRVGMVSC